MKNKRGCIKLFRKIARVSHWRKQEENDLAADYPEKVKDLVSLMEENRTENKYFKLFHN